jgi:signal transduction histidine kinase
MLSTELSERQLLDALPVSIYALDLDGVLTSVHQASSRFSDDAGASIPVVRDDNRGMAIWDALRDSVSREQIEHGMRVLRTGHAPVVRWELERTPQDHRASLAQMTPLHDDAHAVTGYVLSTIDITSFDRTREASADSGVALARTIELEHAYHEATQRIRHALRADLVVIAVADDDTVTPRVVYDYGSDDDRRSLEQRFASVWQSVLRDGAVAVSHADASVSLTSPIPGQPTSHGVVTVVADEIESPEELADARRFLTSVAAQLAAAIDRARQVAYSARRHRSGAIGEVAAGVAHELRNPIFGISSAAQLLRFRAREDPVMEKNVGRILREVERLNRMVATLLELGRPIALKLSSTDPDGVWDDVLETERGRLESRALAIRRTRTSAPASIPIDGEQLAQAFKSILSNAVDAAPEATDISLQSVVLPSGAWRCRLTNGGPPIPAEMLPRVFEPFLSTKPGSTGVGLALAQRIVEEHHGTITIESTAEAGTTVCVTLPESPRTASLP